MKQIEVLLDASAWKNLLVPAAAICHVQALPLLSSGSYVCLNFVFSGEFKMRNEYYIDLYVVCITCVLTTVCLMCMAVGYPW